jgi:uncharacterized protein (TIGR03435 family)
MRPLLLALIVAFQTVPAQPRFEVASVKPSKADNRFGSATFEPGGNCRAINVPLKVLIQVAYQVRFQEMTGATGWLASDRFDIAARAAGDSDREHERLMLRALLEDRFQLKIHRETREQPIYALEVAKNGSKLKESSDSSCVTYGPDHPPPAPGQGPGLPPCGGLMFLVNRIEGGKVDMKTLADTLSNMTAEFDRQVVDKTGLTGSYDIRLEFTSAARLAADENAGPSIFTALQEKLGLKAEPHRAPVEIFVIDHAEQPSEN